MAERCAAISPRFPSAATTAQLPTRLRRIAPRFAFTRDRKSVAAYARRHFPLLVSAPPPIPKPRRRWQRARVEELWQHDSSIHQWWPADDKQTLLLTIDDNSCQLLAGTFVPTDTTWHHFQHFRHIFTVHGFPLALYTDGLALFGHVSTTDGRDPRSEFQRALTALGGTHLVAPSPQAKGKIERRFGTFQNRLLALLAYEKITAYVPAQELHRLSHHWLGSKRCLRPSADRKAHHGKRLSRRQSAGFTSGDPLGAPRQH